MPGSGRTGAKPRGAPPFEGSATTSPPWQASLFPHPPFLLRNLQYVSLKKFRGRSRIVTSKEAHTERVVSLQLDAVQVQHLSPSKSEQLTHDASSQGPINRYCLVRIWLVRDTLVAPKQVTLASYVRDVALPVLGDRRTTSEVCRRIRFLCSELHDTKGLWSPSRVTLEVFLDGKPAPRGPDLVGSYVVDASNGLRHDGGDACVRIVLRKPPPGYASPSLGNPYNKVAEILESCQRTVHAGTSSNVKAITETPGISQKQQESVETNRHSAHRDAYTGSDMYFIDVRVAARQHRRGSVSPNPQLRQPLNVFLYSFRSPSVAWKRIARLDDACPICLRRLGHVSSLFTHMEIEHEEYDFTVSLTVHKANAAPDGESEQSSGDFIFRPTSVRSPRTVVEVDVTPKQIRYTAKGNGRGRVQKRRRTTPAIEDAVSNGAAGRGKTGACNGRSTRPKETVSGPMQIQTACGPGHIAVREDLDDGPELVYVNTSRFRTWSEPDFEWETITRAVDGTKHTVTKAAEARARASDGHPGSPVPTVERGSDQASASTVFDTSEVVRYGSTWARSQPFARRTCQQEFSPGFCSKQCSTSNASTARADRGATASRTFGMRVRRQRPKITPQDAQRMCRPGAPVLYHLPSLARCRPKDLVQGDPDSEEEVDDSWILQYEEEKLLQLPVQVKEKVLWMLWNRFVFPVRGVSGVVLGDRYTRYNLERFVLECGSEIHRLGLRAQLVGFLRACHIHGCIDAPGILSVLHCLDGLKATEDCADGSRSFGPTWPPTPKAQTQKPAQGSKRSKSDSTSDES